MFLGLTCTIQNVLRPFLYMSFNLKESYWIVVVQQLSFLCLFLFFFCLFFHVCLNHSCLRIIRCFIICQIIKNCIGTQFTVQSYQAPLSKESLLKSIQNNVLFFSWFFNTNTRWAYCHIFISSFASLKMYVLLHLVFWYVWRISNSCSVLAHMNISNKGIFISTDQWKTENCKPRL